MPEFERSIEIAVSPPTTFAYLADLPRHREWQLDLKWLSFRPPEAVAVGSEGREVRRVSRTRQSSDLRVEAFDPPRRLTIGTWNRRIEQRREMSIEPVGDCHARVRVTVQVRGRGVVRIIAPMVSRGMARTVEGNLQLLRLILEGRPARDT